MNFNKKAKWHRHFGVYGVCIKDKSKLLVIRKKGGPYTGLFDLPGGGMENPESLKECVIREMLEETGYSIKVVGFFGFFDFITNTPYDGYDYTHHVALMYLINLGQRLHRTIDSCIINNSVVDDNDSMGYEWLNLDNAELDNSSPLVLRVKDVIMRKSERLYDILEYEAK